MPRQSRLPSTRVTLFQKTLGGEYSTKTRITGTQNGFNEQKLQERPLHHPRSEGSKRWFRLLSCCDLQPGFKAGPKASFILGFKMLWFAESFMLGQNSPSCPSVGAELWSVAAPNYKPWHAFFFYFTRITHFHLRTRLRFGRAIYRETAYVCAYLVLC